MNPTRREILYGAAAMAAGWACSQDEAPQNAVPAEPYRFRLAICNETFDGWSFADALQRGGPHGIRGD